LRTVNLFLPAALGAFFVCLLLLKAPPPPLRDLPLLEITGFAGNGLANAGLLFLRFHHAFAIIELPIPCHVLIRCTFELPVA
jgi:hypothetical protein